MSSRPTRHQLEIWQAIYDACKRTGADHVTMKELRYEIEGLSATEVDAVRLALKTKNTPYEIYRKGNGHRTTWGADYDELKY